jgi:hypothetical protein
MSVFRADYLWRKYPAEQ